MHLGLCALLMIMVSLHLRGINDTPTVLPECPYKRPLHQAVFEGKDRTLAFMTHLLPHTPGDHINAKDTGGDTLLHVALKHSPEPEPMVHILMNANNRDGKGIDVCAVNDQGKTSLHLAVERQLSLACLRKLLERWHAGLEDRCKCWNSVSQRCSSYNKTSNCAHYASIEQQDHEGYTSFRRAFEMRFFDGITALVQYGANINEPNKQGVTPLFEAIRENNERLFYSLTYRHYPLNDQQKSINSSAYLRHQDRYGRTALHHALIHTTKSSFISALVAYMGGVNVKDADGKTPLHWAVLKGHNDTIIESIAIMAGKDGIDIQDNEGQTAVHKAVWLNNITAVRIVAQRGASCDIPDNDGNVPLDYAFENSIGWVTTLVACGADPNRKDKNGNTLLHKSLLFNRSPIWMETLIKAGARDDIPNNQGKTAAMLLQNKINNK